MNLQNALYILTVVAIALAAYFAIEMKVINLSFDEVTTDVLSEDPQAHSGNDNKEEMMDDEMSSSSEDDMMKDDMASSSEESEATSTQSESL